MTVLYAKFMQGTTAWGDNRAGYPSIQGLTGRWEVAYSTNIGESNVRPSSKVMK